MCSGATHRQIRLRYRSKINLNHHRFQNLDNVNTWLTDFPENKFSICFTNLEQSQEDQEAFLFVFTFHYSIDAILERRLFFFQVTSAPFVPQHWGAGVKPQVLYRHCCDQRLSKLEVQIEITAFSFYSHKANLAHILGQYSLHRTNLKRVIGS